MKSLNKKSFLLHIDSLAVLDDLTDEQAGMLFRAIKAYQEGEAIELDPFVKIAFSPFRNQFLRDDEKYIETCEKRAKAGAMGGKAKADKANQVLSSASKSQQVPEKVANLTDSDSKNKSDSDSDSKEVTIVAAAPNSASDVLEIFSYWREVMKVGSSSRLNEKRNKAIKARLKEGYSIDEIKTAIYGCSITPHNMGQNDNMKRYNDIELICRDGTNLERFIDNSKSLVSSLPANSKPMSNKDLVDFSLTNINDIDW